MHTPHTGAYAHTTHRCTCTHHTQVHMHTPHHILVGISSSFLGEPSWEPAISLTTIAATSPLVVPTHNMAASVPEWKDPPNEAHPQDMESNLPTIFVRHHLDHSQYSDRAILLLYDVEGQGEVRGCVCGVCGWEGCVGGGGGWDIYHFDADTRDKFLWSLLFDLLRKLRGIREV